MLAQCWTQLTPLMDGSRQVESESDLGSFIPSFESDGGRFRPKCHTYVSPYIPGFLLLHFSVLCLTLFVSIQ